MPQQETIQIRNKGSFTIPEEARKAHRLNLTVEIISVTRNQYGNFNYNPTQGDYCNVTYFVGDSPIETRKVKYAKETLLEWLNFETSIINAVNSAVLVTATNMKTIALAQGILLGELPFTRTFTWAYPVTHLKFVCPPNTQIKVTCTWWPFEYPDFEFAESEPNTATPPGGGNEYRNPRQNNNSEPWDGNPGASAPDPDRDERDYDPANIPPPPPPDCVNYRLVGQYQFGDTNGNPGGAFDITFAADPGGFVIEGGLSGGETYFKYTPCGGGDLVYVTNGFGGIKSGYTLTNLDES